VHNIVLFEVVMVMTNKITGFRDVTLFSLIDKYGYAGGMCSLRLHGRRISQACGQISRR
jgi:hypothetical protein